MFCCSQVNWTTLNYIFAPESGEIMLNDIDYIVQSGYYISSTCSFFAVYTCSEIYLLLYCVFSCWCLREAEWNLRRDTQCSTNFQGRVANVCHFTGALKIRRWSLALRRVRRGSPPVILFSTWNMYRSSSLFLAWSFLNLSRLSILYLGSVAIKTERTRVLPY